MTRELPDQERLVVARLTAQATGVSRRAVALQSGHLVLEQTMRRSGSFERLMDALGLALILYDGDGRVVAETLSAAALLADDPEEDRVRAGARRDFGDHRRGAGF